MNPLQWRLFANRKFQVQDSAENNEIATIYGINQTRAETKYLMLRHPNGYEYESAVGYCTLIARPIEDMTDEEMEEYKSLCQKSENHNAWWMGEYSYIETVDSFLYALSVGCLPRRFEDHFGDTVIDTRTLTNEV